MPDGKKRKLCRPCIIFGMITLIVFVSLAYWLARLLL